MKKKLLSLALALAVCLSLTAPALAAGYAWPIEQVEMGGLGTFVVTSDHSLYTWGKYDSDFWEGWGGAKGNVYAPLWPNETIKQVTKVMDNVQAVAASKFDCINGVYANNPHLPVLMILKTDGSVWVWGDNCGGQLGQGYTEALADRSDFSPVKVLDGVKAIECSGNLCAAITNSGDLYCWGIIVGAPGGSTSAEYRYTIVSTPTKMLSNVTAVSMGDQHTLALTADGTVYAMGSQSEGRLGNGAEKGEPVKEMIRVMDGCTAISAGDFWSLALKTDGTVYAFGHNTINVFGKLNDQVPNYLTPTPIMTNVKQIFSGVYNSAFIKTDNSLWVTGDNMFGTHGQGRVGYDMWTNAQGIPFPCRYTPVQVDTNVKTLDLCGHAMLYVKSDGLMYGTGSSVEGVPEYTYTDNDGFIQISTDPSDGQAAVCTPTLAGTSRTPYTGPWSAAPVQPSGPSAAPTASKVLVNGREVAFDAYTIDGSNYFKLRDLAFVLNGTEKQFEVGWDNASKTITLTSGSAYTANGSEMAKGSGAQSAAVSASKLLIDGKEVSLTAYTIGGNNYFKLRDIGQAFDFGIGWDSASKTITIDTGAGYMA